MLDKSLRSNINHVVSCCFRQFFIISQSSDRLNSVKVLDRFLDSSWPFLGSESRLSRLFQEVTLKSSKILLQVRNEGSWISAKFILKFENRFVNFTDIPWER